MTTQVALLGTFHPAVPTFRRLVERGQIAMLIVPERAGPKNDELLAIAVESGVPWSYDLSDLDTGAIDLVVAANYPKIVPERVLDEVPCINTHWSLLPRYRGVHPTAWALLNGDDETGVTVHLMEGEFDTGPILAQTRVPLDSKTRIVDLHRTLADVQAELVLEVLDHFSRHQELPPAYVQDESQATYVPQRVPVDGLIDWSWPTARIDALIRALPLPQYPGAFTYLNGHKLIISEAEPAPTPPYFSTPGQVVRLLDDGAAWVKTGDTCLAIRSIQTDFDELAQPATGILRRGAKLGLRLDERTTLLEFHQIDDEGRIVHGNE